MVFASVFMCMVYAEINDCAKSKAAHRRLCLIGGRLSATGHHTSHVVQALSAIGVAIVVDANGIPAATC